MILPAEVRRVYANATCLYTREQVEKALDKMAFDINVRFSSTNPIFLCIVVGGIVPLGNLLPRLDFPLEIDYIHLTRYQGKTQAGELVFKNSSNHNMKDRTVVIVDDILDSGLTIAACTDFCRKQGAKEIFSVVLVDKQKPREPGGLEKADVFGLTVDDHYVFGYGLDYKEYLRNAPGIYAVAQEDLN